MKHSQLNNQHLFINQQLPHNFLAEQMVLSGLLISSDAVEITIKTLPIEAFYFNLGQSVGRCLPV